MSDTPFHDHDEVMQRIERDLIDSYDEELELEIDDRRLTDGGEPGGFDAVDETAGHGLDLYVPERY